MAAPSRIARCSRATSISAIRSIARCSSSAFWPLARQLARRYQRPEEPFDDLFQVACLGLINAIDRFDFDRGVA
jgi:RNA polymerase sigma-B factor